MAARIRSLEREHRKLHFDKASRERRAQKLKKDQIQRVEVAIETLLLAKKIYPNHMKMLNHLQSKLEILTQ